MSLIPWRGKREGQQGDLSPMVALRNEMDRLFDSFVREPFGAIDWPLWAPASGRRPSTWPRTTRS